MAPSGRASFAQFYRETLLPLRLYLARMLGNRSDAEDLAHDAYLRVYEAMGGQPIGRPAAYLYTTARRLALNRIRRRRIAPVQEDDGIRIIDFAAAAGPGVPEVVMAQQEWAKLEAAIAALPAGCRSVLLLRKRERLAMAEIGARLGIAVSTVEKQHARALRLLRAALDDEPPRASPECAETTARAAGR